MKSDTIDSVLDKKAIGKVDLLKMDMEDAEELALRGMDAGLRSYRYRRVLPEIPPVFLAELGISGSEVFAGLRASGYRAWWIDHSKAATRRAAYTFSPKPRGFLRPVTNFHDPLDPWPHMLSLAPGVDAPV